MRMHDVKPASGGDYSGKTDLPRLGPLPREELEHGASSGTGSDGRAQAGGISLSAPAQHVFGIGAPLALLAAGAMNWR